MSEGERRDGFTEDHLLGGQVSVFQPENGYRVSTDSVLLAAALGALPEASRIQTGLELGCGAGGALFPAAFHLPQTRFIAIEADEAMAALACKGAKANGWDDRISVRTGGIEALVPAMENEFDLVFSNPPFFDPAKTSPPGAGKTEAYLESLPLDGWLKAMLFAAKPKAHIVLIHRAAELARILMRLDRQGGQICVLPIRSHPSSEAIRVIVSARKGLKRGPVRLLSGLDLHDAQGGGLTGRADALMSGGPLAWH